MARDVRDYQEMNRLSWHNTVFFGCKNQNVVAVTKRFKSGPVKSRVSAFPDFFGMTNGRFKGTVSRSGLRVRFGLATGELRLAMSDVGWQQFTTYWGALPWRHR